MEPKKTESPFAVHRLNADGLARADELCAAYEALLAVVTKHCPPGREMALVVTNLQTAAFWSKRGMATQPENQATQESRS